jgi:hypothetical protein
LSHRSFDRVREAHEPEWNRRGAKFLRLQGADWDTIKSRDKVCGDLSRFLFGDGIGRILFTGLKDVLKRAAVLGRASVSKQLN